VTLWLTAHAPRRFEDLLLPEQIRIALFSASMEGDPPHLLISGPAGSGKTTAWKLIARQVLGPGWKATHHVLQARDIAGSSGAMGKFEDFLRDGSNSSSSLANRTSLDAFDRSLWSSSSDDPPPGGSEIDLEDGRIPISRIIIIEDADHLGMKRQAYLRRMMEKSGKTSRFILVARSPSRIIDALRSRTRSIRFPSVPSDKIEKLLRKIAQEEKTTVSDGVFGDIAHISNGDLRKAIFTLDLLVHRGLAHDREAVVRLVNAVTLQAGRQMVELAIRGRVNEWKMEKIGNRRQRTPSGALRELDRMLREHALEGSDIVNQVHMAVMSGRLSIPEIMRQELLDVLALTEVEMIGTQNPRIHLHDLLHQYGAIGRSYGLSVG